MQKLGGTPQMWTLLSFTGRFDVAFLENAIARGAKGPPTMPGERTEQQKQQVRDAQMGRANKFTMIASHGGLHKEDHSFVDIGGSTGGFVRTVLDDWESPDLADFEGDLRLAEFEA